APGRLLLLPKHTPFHKLRHFQLGYHGSDSLTPGIHYGSALDSIFKSSEGSLIVISSKTPTVSGQMTNSFAVCALHSVRPIMMQLALVA
nr:hypothetical protein [Tanacetum cinerariifolium]